jgi:hypothetical protein
MAQTVDLHPLIDERGRLVYAACPRQLGPCRSCIPGLVVTAVLAAILAVLNRLSPRE